MNKDEHFQALLNKVAFSGDKPNEFMLSEFYSTGKDNLNSDATSNLINKESNLS